MALPEDFLSLALALPGIIGQFTNTAELPSGVEDALRRNKKIAKALMYPDNPLYQGLVDQQEAGIRSNYAEALRGLQIGQNRAYARGTSTINPERRDEAISQTMGRAFDESRQQAQQNARAFLQAAAGVNAQALGAAPVGAQLSTDYQQRAQLAGGLESIFDIGSRLLNGDPNQSLAGQSVAQMTSDRAQPSISGSGVSPGVYNYYGNRYFQQGF